MACAIMAVMAVFSVANYDPRQDRPPVQMMHHLLWWQ